MLARKLLALVAIATGLVLPTPPARAQNSATLRFEDVVVSAEAPWPLGLNKGWQPVFVQLENKGSDAADIRLECSNGWNPPRTTTHHVRLAGGALTSLEMLVYSDSSESKTLRAHVSGKREQAASLGGGLAPRVERRAVVVFAERLPAPGTKELWQAEISTDTLLGAHASGRHGMVTVASGPATSIPHDNIQVVTATYALMPQRTEAYSSLDLVVLDTRGAPPSGSAAQPLMAWVRTGGCLAVFGPDAMERARQLPGAEGWLEPRFLVKTEEGVERYAVGLGMLLVGPDTDVLSDGGQVRAVRWACERVDVSVVHDPAGSRLDHVHPTIPGLGRLPFRAFSALLIVFAIVIGPVNFVLVKKSRKPVLLLITIPALALVCSLLLLVYGIASQGLGIKTASYSWTVLDQRDHRAATVEKRMLYAGLALAPGLRPAAGTSCYLVEDFEPEPVVLRGFGLVGESSGGGPIRVDETDGMLLSGHFLPARVEVVQQILGERAARGRLEIYPEGESFAVENGLEDTLNDLVLRDAAGEYHSATGALAPGAKVLLERDPAGAEKAIKQLLLHADNFWPLVPATWTARIGRNAFGDDCGLDVREVEGHHHVLGVLDLEAAWR